MMRPKTSSKTTTPKDDRFGARVALFRSTVFRFSLLYLCLFTSAVLLLAAFLYWAVSDSAIRQVDRTIDAEIRGLAEQYRQRGTNGLIEAVRRRSASASETRGLYLVTDPNYRSLAGNLSRWPDESPDPQGWVTFRLGFPESEGGGINFGRARTFDLGGGLHLLVGHDVRERSRIAAMVRDSLAWGLAGIVALTVIGGVLMSRTLLRRIESVNRTSREIVAGDMTRRIPVSGRNDEFDALAESLNAMLDQIERLLAGMKQVSDNIAHDLRSPLTRMRSRLEGTLMEQARSEQDNEAREAIYREAISQSIVEADQLLSTFAALLSIAQAESGAPRDSFQPVDLAEILRDVVELYEPLAEENGLRLIVEHCEPATVAGDRHLLFQALVNLVDNAIKFSSPKAGPKASPKAGPKAGPKADPEAGPESGADIALTLRRTAASAVASVRDHGAGIAESDLERVQQRFVRLERSRSTPGAGLGLSLVAAVARLHGGELRLCAANPGSGAPGSGAPGSGAPGAGSPGLVATLELPRGRGFDSDSGDQAPK